MPFPAFFLNGVGGAVVDFDGPVGFGDHAAGEEDAAAEALQLHANGWDCIAAAHAYAAEPQLFSEVRFSDPPPSWTGLLLDPKPGRESYATAVWGALRDYDWPDLVGEAP